MKKIFAVAMATVMTVAMAVPAFAATNLEDGLVGYYTFDDTLENTVGDGSATIHGGAGANWNGGATISEAVYATGKNGKAYSFAGDLDATEANQGDGLELDVKTTEEYTIGMWVKTAEKVNFQSIIFIDYDFDSFISVGTQFNDFASGALALYGGWPHVVSTGQAVWLDKNDADSVSDVKDIAVDTWTYVTLTATESGTFSLYYDGKLLANGDVASYDGRYSDQFIFLGINFWDASYKGLMDDVVVYDRALSATEVADLYAANGVPVTAEPTPSETEDTEDATETGDMTAVLPVAILAVAAMAVVVVMRKRTVAE